MRLFVIFFLFVVFAAPAFSAESPVVVKTPKIIKEPPKWKPTLDRKGFEVDVPGSQPKSGPNIGVKAGLVDVSDDEAAISEQDPNLVIAFLQQKISGSDLLLGEVPSGDGKNLEDHAVSTVEAST
jgi:hypothetical protein